VALKFDLPSLLWSSWNSFTCWILFARDFWDSLIFHPFHVFPPFCLAVFCYCDNILHAFTFLYLQFVFTSHAVSCCSLEVAHVYCSCSVGLLLSQSPTMRSRSYNWYFHCIIISNFGVSFWAFLRRVSSPCSVDAM
jgi:hypothetical protein